MLLHLLQSAILGSIQGITEFLPISSTAHLVLLQNYFQFDPKTYGLTFDMFTNLGTLLAVVWFFRKDIKKLLADLRLPSRKNTLNSDQKLAWNILIVTFIVAVVGYFLQDYIEGPLRQNWIIAASLIIIGVVLWIAERMPATTSGKTENTSRKTYIIGLSQILAFIPGVSRSGITISTGIFSGLKRESAARISFLLSIPITTIAVLKKLLDFAAELSSGGIGAEVLLNYFVGLFFATLLGFFTIKFLLEYLKSRQLYIFAAYRIILGIIILINL